ncbi:MAG: hypothetical protein KJ852_17920 [Gammaproteobacteria bacterium]|nr:hypothetical protein [Gammaproteobacteria bacterium]MBU0785491.1 hypothetical protein [Gammaproteobacteria bacterium]MBU0813691.1 hypothetical protein [Gammaproteobacteria bacterium]MBU1788837.1 hypothetical protein [Gammaproteobacteria bacterium]
MNRITRVGTFFAAMALIGCATENPPEEMKRLKSSSDEAMRVDANCATKNIAKIDDGFSDASTVALALSSVCVAEYAQATEAFGQANLDNDTQRRMFSNRREQVGTKIEYYLPTVMSYRKWLRSRRSSDAEKAR